MKDQYFGDVNDFDKYFLLRLILRHGLSVSVIWMLTPDDRSSDGRKLGYLDRPGSRAVDPQLFDFLRQWKDEGATKDVRLIERSGLIGSKFFSDQVPSTPAARTRWIDDALRASRSADVVFFDPDNGLETGSLPRTTKFSTKHLYWHELSRAWDAGHSVLVYQHYARVTVSKMIDRCGRRAAEVLGAGCMYVVRLSGFASFFAFCRNEHVDRFDLMAKAMSWDILPLGIGRGSLKSDEQVVSLRSTGSFRAYSGEPQPETEPAALKPESRSSRARRKLEPPTTRIGTVNRNRQEVVRRTDLPGTDHGQRIYVLRCHACLLEYGANGTDVWCRKCPRCQGGRPGLAFQ